MAATRSCLKKHSSALTGFRAVPFSVMLAIPFDPAHGGGPVLEKPLYPAYNLGQWVVGPVALGLLLCLLLLGFDFARRGKYAPQPLTNAAGATHLRCLVLVLLAFYLLCIFSGLIVEMSAGSSAAGVVAANQDQAGNLQLEALFGRFRTPLREGSLSTFLCVAAIVCSLNTIGAVTIHFIPGVLLIPGVALLGYVGWQQGMTLATSGASTIASMLGFLSVIGLESSTYVLGVAAGIHVALALVSPAWVGTNTREAALRATLKTALKLFGIVVTILIAQALCEAFYVRQVLLHGGSGVPLMPY